MRYLRATYHVEDAGHREILIAVLSDAGFTAFEESELLKTAEDRPENLTPRPPAVTRVNSRPSRCRSARPRMRAQRTGSTSTLSGAAIKMDERLAP